MGLGLGWETSLLVCRLVTALPLFFAALFDRRRCVTPAGCDGVGVVAALLSLSDF